MHINKIIGTSVGADVSAFVGFHNTPLHLIIHIIGPNTHQPMHRSWGESCHAECNEASRPACEILRFAQNDKCGGILV